MKLDLSRLRTKHLAVAAAGLVALFGSIVLVSSLRGPEESFPDIPVGAYGGKISGLGTDAERKQVYTLFAERLRKRKALLAVIFSAGAKPQVVALRTRELPEDEEQEPEEDPGLQPVTLRHNDRAYQLTGRLADGELSGTVTLDGSVVGNWSLQPLDARDLREDISVDSAKVNLANWLDLQSIGQMLRKQDAEVSRELEEKLKTYGRLAEYVESKESLVGKAKIRKAELEQEIAALTAERQQLLRELQGAVNRLEQLSRITRRGQTIDLARRVAKREYKWYEVNWQTGADLTSLEESLAEQMNIDLDKLRQGVSQAEEYQQLQATIAKERAEIQGLQQAYRRKIEQSTRPQVGGEPQPQQPAQPWWKKWETIFQ